MTSRIYGPEPDAYEWLEKAAKGARDVLAYYEEKSMKDDSTSTIASTKAPSAGPVVPKRYSLWCAATHGHGMMESLTGGYVTYDDYVRLAAINADLLAALENLLTVWPNSDKKPGWVGRWTEAQDIGRAAIAKARMGA